MKFMAIKLSPQCKICQTISEGDTKLLARLYQSAAYRGRKGEAIADIQEAYPQFTVGSIKNHCRVHQGLTSKDIQKELVAQADQEQATLLAREAIDSNQARQTIINKGMQRIESGEAKIEPTHVLQATKQVADIEAKQTDQSLLMKQMFLKFMSGELEYVDPDEESADEHTGTIDLTPTPSAGVHAG